MLTQMYGPDAVPSQEAWDAAWADPMPSDVLNPPEPPPGPDNLSPLFNPAYQTQNEALRNSKPQPTPVYGGTDNRGSTAAAAAAPLAPVYGNPDTRGAKQPAPLPQPPRRGR